MMNALAQAALSVSAFPVSIVVKATVVLGVAFLVLRLTRRAAASVRHLVLAAAFAVLAALPLVDRVVPSISLPVGHALTVPTLPITRVDLTDRAAAPPVSRPGPARPSVRGSSTWSTRRLLASAWGLGAFVCLVPVLLTPWRLRQLRARARRWQHGDALVSALRGDRAIGVAVFVHDRDTPPLTYGMARPAILLPAAAEQWSEDDIQRALVHELEHVRRGDWFVYVVSRVVCAVYWFHPLAWVAWRRLGLEAERACDDAVVRMADGTAYAQQLLTLARARMNLSATPVLSMAGRSDLSARVAAVLDDTQMRGRLGRARAASILAAAGLITAAVGPLRAQSTQITLVPKADVPAFDVVSIRENKSGGTGPQRINRQPGGRIVIGNYPLRRLVQFSYGLQPQQLVGGPDWIDAAFYDITAQASGEFPVTEPGTVGPPQLMLQRMLAERFQLVVHTEQRELPIYALTLARKDGRLGPRLKAAAVDCQALMAEALRKAQSGGGPPQLPQRPDGSPACGLRMMLDGRVSAGGTSMAALGSNLSGLVGRLVEDRSGLKGGFDFDLEFLPDAATLPAGFLPAGVQLPPPANANAPSLFTALEEQLGIKLEAVRTPVEVLVIDRVERPTEN